MAEKNTKGAISIRNVTKIYDPEGVNVMAVDDCSLEIKSGEVCMIVGPSGCGKTTLLNAIAGFHSITEGEIYLDNEILCGPNKPLADQGSDRIVVFQHGALFPWKTLQENVAYGPTVQKTLGGNEAMSKAGDMLAEAGLGNFLKCKNPLVNFHLNLCLIYILKLTLVYMVHLYPFSKNHHLHLAL